VKVIQTPTELKKLWQESETGFVDLIKIVVDIDREIIAADAEMHADLEEVLLSGGSSQEFLWGANLYPDKAREDFIEYTAFSNIRPSQHNRSMEVEDPEIRSKIKSIVEKLIII
jgi:hypothetical protein